MLHLYDLLNQLYLQYMLHQECLLHLQHLHDPQDLRNLRHERNPCSI